MIIRDLLPSTTTQTHEDAANLGTLTAILAVNQIVHGASSETLTTIYHRLISAEALIIHGGSFKVSKIR